MTRATPITSSTQLIAAMALGKPMPVIASSTVWRISSGVAPASSARRVWEWTAPSDRPPIAMARRISSAVFASSGPAFSRDTPSCSSAVATAGKAF